MPKFQGIEMSEAAARNVKETGIDVAGDVALLSNETGSRLMAARKLLKVCLEGADADRIQGWKDYVMAVYLTASKE